METVGVKRQLMAEQWNLFNKILPKAFSTELRTEMRRAFYAGAHGLYITLMFALSSEAEPTAQDLQMGKCLFLQSQVPHPPQQVHYLQ